MPESSAPPSHHRALILLLSVAVGVAAANLYYVQPLAAAIARDLRASDVEVGTAKTLAQVGYTLGMLLLVPLGDGRERRSTIVVTASAAVVALLLVAVAPSILVLEAASLLVGLASSVVQMIIPYAVSLGPSERRGQIVGSVMSGLLMGILLSRTASGAIGAALGWRAMYVIAAAAMAVLSVVLRLVLPLQRPPEPLPWLAILRSMGRVFLSQPTLRRRAFIGALGMASFSVFWSMLSFHFGTLGHGSAVAGLFGAIGVVGVLAAPIAGRFASGSTPARVNVLGLGAVALSFLVFSLGARSLVAIGVGVVLLDVGVQSSHLANQTVIYGLSPALRNRLNALYMVAYFLGGTGGTLAASIAWSLYRWPGVCALGAAFAIAGIVPLLVELGGGGQAESSG